MGSSVFKEPNNASNQNNQQQQIASEDIPTPPSILTSVPIISFDISSRELGLLKDFPQELFLEFIKNISDSDLLNFSLTCKSAHEILSDDSLWTQLLPFRNIDDIDEDYPKPIFPRIKYWYFFQKNKLHIELVAKEDIPPSVLEPPSPKRVGYEQSGKTQLFHVLCGYPFVENYASTIGVDFLLSFWKHHEEYQKLQFWDTAGDPRFRAIVQNYFKGAHVVLLVYSASNRRSFEEMDSFFSNALSDITQCCTFILVANFQDDEEHIKVTSEEGKEWVNKHNSVEKDGKKISVLFVEVSAKTGKGLRTLRKMIWQAYCPAIVHHPEVIRLD